MFHRLFHLRLPPTSISFLRNPLQTLQFRCRLCTRPTNSNSNTIKQATDTAKDIIIYKHLNPKYLKYLAIFGYSQFFLWSIVGLNILSMRDIPVSAENENASFLKRINWGNSTTKTIFAVGCFSIGYISLAMGSFYILRCIRYIILRKDQTTVSFVTYTPFGGNRIINNVPLGHITCEGSRHQTGTSMPIRIKGKRFRFIIDLKPESYSFPNPQLFDRTIGMKRF